MFGYIYVNQQELKVRELETYRGYYCGLCRELKKRYGRTGQILLNYDMTFLALFLTGLYEPSEQKDNRRCIVHPVRKHLDIRSEITEYAADMTILLAYQKARDDWEDERKVGKRLLSVLLAKDYRRIQKKYPRQSRVLEECLRGLHQAERENSQDLDRTAAYTGRFLGEMFVWKEDIWQEQLREFGFFLGKFVYLLDALEDMEQDAKSHNYNPLLRRKELLQEHFAEDTKTILIDLMTRSAAIFETLPILEQAEILRNILYSGVWCRYQLILEKRKRREELRSK